ncbi:MAG: TetR/AcrR family transcriptional regulator [Deltaproteobacteria bacterium]|nr:TetR/AcrR family transcriptional regulator [Deltaproteobacteria bacterium]
MSPKTRIPRQQRGIETRDSILAAARELFSAKGFHGTNSKEIAGRAGVSIGSFYSYFKNKKVLFMEVFKAYKQEQIIRILREQNRQRIETLGRATIVRAIIESILAAHDLSPGFDREAMVMCYADPEVKEYHGEIERQINAQLVETLRQVEDRLRVTDLEAAAAVVSNAVVMTVHSIKIFDAPLPRDRLIDALAEMIRRFLFNDSEAPAG